MLRLDRIALTAAVAAHVYELAELVVHSGAPIARLQHRVGGGAIRSGAVHIATDGSENTAHPAM